MSDKVHVTRNIRRDAPLRWVVLCDWCSTDSLFGGSLDLVFGGQGAKGGAKTWRQAQDYAQRHAMRHEETRCPTCLHVPREVPAEERASA